MGGEPLSIEQIGAALDEAFAPACARMAAAATDAQGRMPSPYDWATGAELAEVHRLQLLLTSHPGRSARASRERVARRRAARRRAASGGGS